MSEKGARTWFAATAACAFAGVLISAINAANSDAPHLVKPFPTALGRALNTFAYFTIDSNILVLVACLLLAIGLQRTSTAFAALRLTGLVAIAVTGVVYHTVLSGLLDLKSWAVVANELVHTIVPLLAVLGWLLAGPRRKVSPQTLLLSLVFPLLWVTFTLIRGEVVGWYPYPFIDVTQLGYARVALNCVWVTILLIGLAAGVKAWEARRTSVGAI